jgi:hypothetical protein
MAIKFPCPNCGKMLSVKEQLAGKRGACSGCKKVITIPFPVSQAHHPDIEALAREAFAEDKAAAPAVETKFIEFDCPMCSEKVKVSAELEGKQAPCPECRRIIKVPLLVKNEPKDWRTVKKGGPAGAKQSTEPAPEGAWGSTAVTGVSREALEETGVIVEEEDADDRRRRLMRYTLAGIGVVTAAIIFLGVLSFLSSGKADKYLDQALDLTKSESAKTTPEQAAAVHWAAAEYRLRSGTPDAALRASEEYGQARGALTKSPSLEHDVMLLNLALAQIDLGGDKVAVDKGRALDWSKALESVRQTLERIHSPEAKEEAVRLVARKLAERGQVKAVQSLAGKLGGAPAAPGTKAAEPAAGNNELVAIAALELLRAGSQKEAAALADSALAAPPPGKDKTPRQSPVRPAIVALAIALGREEPKPRMSGKKGEEKPDADDVENLALGRVVGLARRGDLAATRDILAAMRIALRLRALADIAALRVENDPSQNEELLAALDIAMAESQSQVVSHWLLYRVAQLAAQAGLDDRALQLANKIPDVGLKAQAQLAVFRERMRTTSGVADEARAREVASDTGASIQALQLLARHNTFLDRSTVKSVETWKDGEKAAGLAGVALGLQDKKK